MVLLQLEAYFSLSRLGDLCHVRYAKERTVGMLEGVCNRLDNREEKRKRVEEIV